VATAEATAEALVFHRRKVRLPSDISARHRRRTPNSSRKEKREERRRMQRWAACTLALLRHQKLSSEVIALPRFPGFMIAATSCWC
jgi:hypothetical protein